MSDYAENESVWGPIVGWGALGIFAIGFAWHVGAPLIMGERWAGKQDAAIALVKDFKPAGQDQSFYDLIRAYSLDMRDNSVYIGEFSWDALQRNGPNYEVTLLWTEGTAKKVALWRVNLEDNSQRPQGNEAVALIKRVAEGEPEKAP
jgi:hypothetical protein